MTAKEQNLTIIGRAEKADLLDLGVHKVPVKIDTGADSSSIWAHVTEEESDNLHVVFFGEGSNFYTGEEHIFNQNEYSLTRISNSFGHSEIRYKVKLRIRIKGRVINGTFTLSDRSKKMYPVLIGRSLLMKKFLVDVSKGSPLRERERDRAQRIQKNGRAERLQNELTMMKGGIES